LTAKYLIKWFSKEALEMGRPLLLVSSSTLGLTTLGEESVKSPDKGEPVSQQTVGLYCIIIHIWYLFITLIQRGLGLPEFIYCAQTLNGKLVLT
jgi:hypothetical protein